MEIGASHFEFVVCSTPQHNHLAEFELSVLIKHGVALIVKAHVPMKIRCRRFREASKRLLL